MYTSKLQRLYALSASCQQRTYNMRVAPPCQPCFRNNCIDKQHACSFNTPLLRMHLSFSVSWLRTLQRLRTVVWVCTSPRLWNVSVGVGWLEMVNTNIIAKQQHLVMSCPLVYSPLVRYFTTVTYCCLGLYLAQVREY